VTKLKFPSREWVEAAAAALAKDPQVQTAVAEFGAVVAGVVLQRGGGLAADFCVLARIAPGRAPVLSYPEDEDELDELEPDYLAWVPYTFCKSLMQSEKPDPLKAILTGQVKLKGDLQRLVKHAGRHQGAGQHALRALQTEFV
jgi:hypothetical protein